MTLRYLNRLSDYFFAAARIANARLGIADVEYERSAIVFGKETAPNYKLQKSRYTGFFYVWHIRLSLPLSILSLL